MKKIFILLLFVSSVFASCSSVNTGRSQKNKTTVTVREKSILQKYSAKLNVPTAKLQTPQLYEIIDQWIGVPYKYGGNSKKGIDCSGFVHMVYKTVTGKTLPRSSKDMYKEISPSNKLEEGDLLFFNYENKNSHVGIYLHNGKFVHASTSLGVTISDLYSDHYKKTFNRGGPLKTGRLSKLSIK